MSEGLNRVMLLGNLGADPELRYTQSGQAVLNLRLATTETYFDRDRQKKERTDWHNVVVWGKRGEALSRILGKGSSIFVEGSLRTSSYEGRDGTKRYRTEVNARNIILTGSGRGRAGSDPDRPVDSGGTGGEYGSTPPPSAATTGSGDSGGGGGGGGSYDPGYEDDDIPF